MTDHITQPSGDNPNSVRELETLLSEIEAGNAQDPYTFTSRTLIQATFPHSARAGREIVLTNGNMTVTMYSPTGLPYGVYPRLIMCWLTREALRRKHIPISEARVIPLGKSLTDFLKDLGATGASGGKTGNIGRVKTQLKALFSTFISIKISGTENHLAFEQIDNTLVAESSMLWWDPKHPDQLGLHESTVTLTEDFYRELTRSAVPLDNHILREIKRSPIAIDLYCWITYRLSYHKGITVVTWDQLRQQFGAGYADTAQGKRDFKKRIIGALDRILEVWPAATVTVAENGLMLRPGEPSVPKKIQGELKESFDNPKF